MKTEYYQLQNKDTRRWLLSYPDDTWSTKEAIKLNLEKAILMANTCRLDGKAITIVRITVEDTTL